MCLIVDLSAPHNNDEHSSLNQLINKVDYSLSYVKLDDAIQEIRDKGQGSWLCKTDTDSNSSIIVAFIWS